MTRFDPLAVPLEGVQLLEASAGTGKTHSLADLHLRWLLEGRDLDVTRVLVVTFTNAAAAELRERLRARLLAASAAVEAAVARGRVQDGIVAARLAAGAHAGDLRDRLRRALADYDRAPVCTIHSFCQRVLRERVFECGAIPGAELAPSSADLLQRVARDFLRGRVAGVTGPAAGHLLRATEAESFVRIAGIAGGAEDYTIEPAPGLAPDAGAAATELDRRAAAVRARWARERPAAERQLSNAAVMNQSRYAAAKVPGWFDAVGAWCEQPLALPAPVEALTKLSPASIGAGAKKDKPVPDSRLFEAIALAAEAVTALDEAVAATVAGWRADFARVCRALRRDVCERLDLRAFDDLIALVRDALRGPRGASLARALGRDYPVALIDEFQDTDPAQYEIFRAMHEGGGTSLVLIGDPKQSIYAFRGADIRAYGRAAATARKHALTENWRSTPRLLDAINAVFLRPGAFVLDFIGYEKVVAAERPQVPALLVDGKPAAPFVIRLDAPDAETGKAWTKERASRRVCAALAAEIVGLLAPGSRARIRLDGEPRPLVPRDIAVLVYKHAQAEFVRQALEAAGVPTVLSTRDSVFASTEARELWSVLHALARPRDAALLRGAALLPAIGWTLADLERAAEQPARWDDLFDRWQRHHAAWAGQGFARMFHRLLAAEGTVERLLATPDGPRRVTNLRHLGELLSEAAAERHFGPAALADWLAAQLDGGAGAEETEVRLESDADRVRVATIHASKGLQYPVVFCPFLWHPSADRGDAPPVVCHPPDGGDGRVLDVGGPRLADHVQQRRAEGFEEGVRLCYVALTRAKAACRIAWGPYRDIASSPMAWLLHPREGGTAGAPVDDLADWDAAAVARDLRALAKSAAGAIAIEPLDPEPPAPLPPVAGHAAALRPREFRGHIDDAWRLSSFSQLHAAGAGTVEAPDHDDDVPDAAVPPPDEVEPRFRLPGGPGCGNALHALFERVDFRAAAPRNLADEVARILPRHGIAAQWRDTVARLVVDTLDTPLDRDGLRLRDLEPARCLREMAFLHPVAHLTPDALARAVGEAGPAAPDDEPGRLTFAPFHGFMKGFMDLVFEWKGRIYLLDYKSNQLGPSPDDYAPPRLERAMAEAGYRLQYMLYCAALRRHLRSCGWSDERFAREFGGVYYLFLRGLRPADGPARGVFFARPDPARIIALSDLFDGGVRA